MADDPSPKRSRRTVLLTSGVLGTGAFSGCLGLLGEDGDDDDSGSGAGAGLGGSGNDDDGGEPADPLLSDSFDPENPEWLENNYLGSHLDEAGYERGAMFDLEDMGDRGREEPAHGEPVQEHPDDESEWIDPDPIVYADLPREDAVTAYEDSLSEMIEMMEDLTGKTVEFQSVDNYAAVVEGMRSERIHVANFATGNTPFGVNLAGAVPLAMGIEDGSFGYRLYAMTRAGMDEIQSVEDFNDHDVVHTEPTSNSGNQAPSALFDENFGLTVGENYHPEFSGGHEQSARAIAFGDADCGPICSTCLVNTVEAVDDIEWDDFKMVWASNPFPPGPIAYRYNLHPDIIDAFEEIWLETDWSGTEYGEEAGYPEYAEVDYKNHWHDVLVNQRFNEVDYGDGI